MEPTYRLEPKIKFSCSRAQKLIQTILDSRVQRSLTAKFKEDADQLTLSITDEIRASVRDLWYERYRLVVVVSVGDLAAGFTDVLFASRCLWDPRVDTFAEASVYTPRMYAVAVVYAVYCE